MGILSALRAKVLGQPVQAGTEVMPYPRIATPYRQPGPGYVSAILQFQSWVQESQFGAGTPVNRFFQPFEPQYANAAINQVNSGTSGTITGQVWAQPLTDTTAPTGAG